MLRGGFERLSTEEHSYGTIHKSEKSEWERKNCLSIALFDPLIQKFRIAFDDKYAHQFKKEISPLEKAIEEYKESEEKSPNVIVTSDDTKNIVDTKLIQDLDETCRRALHDYRESLEIQFTDGNTVRKNYIDDRKQDFFENGIKRYAFEFEKLFNGLISYDNYPERLFKNYKQIKRLIDTTEGKTSATLVVYTPKLKTMNIYQKKYH